MKNQNQEQEKVLTNIEIIEKHVNKYIEKNGVTPFANIDLQEDGNLNVDMDSTFEAELTNELKENFSDALSEYFTNVIREMVKKMENGEIQIEDFIDDSPQGIPEAP